MFTEANKYIKTSLFRKSPISLKLWIQQWVLQQKISKSSIHTNTGKR